jgi:GNAT superfamily N-acetyltransferase
VSEYEIRALSGQTWDAFVKLCERHNGGGFGGCWCTWFHLAAHSAPKPGAPPRSSDRTRDFKHNLVETGHAHAALVFDGETAVGWAQYGSPDELPGIAHRREVELAGSPLPDWRITCVFVDRLYRRRGVARTAVGGALELIAQAGGGTVETYPQDTAGKKVSASFLYNATRATFEDAGFTYVRPKGKNHCVMRTTVPGPFPADHPSSKHRQKG